MKPLPIILIAGWGYPGQAMSLLKEALDGCAVIGQLEGGVDAVRQNRGLPFCRTAATTETFRPIRVCRIPPITEGLRSAVQVTSTGELWQTRTGGASSRWNGLSRYAAGLCERLAAFGGQVDVIGWSMGGIVALEAAREYPGLIQRLVIISGAARFCVGNDDPPGVPAAVVRAMSLGLRRTPEAILTAFYEKAHAPQDMPIAEAAAHLVGRGVPAEPCPLDRDELIQGLDYLQQTDLRSGLDKLAVPTLVVHGREDRIVPWQAGEWLSRRLAESQWCCHAGLGHALPIKAAPLLAADIRAFLA